MKRSILLLTYQDTLNIVVNILNWSLCIILTASHKLRVEELRTSNWFYFKTCTKDVCCLSSAAMCTRQGSLFAADFMWAFFVVMWGFHVNLSSNVNPRCFILFLAGWLSTVFRYQRTVYTPVCNFYWFNVKFLLLSLLFEN